MTGQAGGVSLVYPTYYHTFANSAVNVQTASPVPLSPFCNEDLVQYSRLAAGLVGEYLMMVIPRQPIDGNGYLYSTLEFQCNAIGLANQPPTVNIVQPGVSAVNLVPPVYAMQPGVCFYPRIEVLQGVTATIFWAASYDGAQAPTLSYFTSLFTGPTAFTKTSDNQTATLEIQNGPTAALTDFTSASINETIYMFWANTNDVNIYVNPVSCSFAPALTTSGQQVQMTGGETVAPIQLPAGCSLLSLDAAVVHTGSTLDNNGVTSTAIAVALLYDLPEGPGFGQVLEVQLYDPAAGTVTPLYSEAAPVSCGPGASVRVAWGSLPLTTATPGTTVQAANGLTVAVTPVNATPINDAAARAGTVTAAVIDLTPTPARGSISPWTNLTPPLGNYLNEPNVHNDNQAIWVLSQTAALLPMPTYAADGSNAGVYQVGLVGVACVNSKSWYGDVGWFIEPFTAPMPAFNLTLTPGAAQAVNDFSAGGQWGPDDIQCAITTWQLLGVVAGLPPYPADAPSGATASVSVSYGSSASSSTSQTSSKSLKVGGSLSICSTSVTYAATQSSGLTQQSSISNTFNFNLGQAVPGASVGWLLFYQPNYILNQSTVATWGGGGVSAGVVFQELMQGSGVNPGGFAAIEFNIADPSTPIDPKDPAQATLAQFAPSVVWPSTADPAAWSNYYTTESWKLQPVPSTSFPTIQVSDDVDTVSLQSQSSSTVSSDTTLTIEGSVKCQFMNKILGFDVGGSLKTSVSGSLAVASTFTVSVTYGGFGPNHTYLLEPQFYMASGPGAPWVPSILSSQQPWLLTWQVSGADAVQKTAAPTAKK